VAVGRALVRQPKVFLFDEPLSNLDAKMRVQMRAEISRLHRRLDATMIYVTHDQTEAMTFGERICVMKDGHIMQVDEPLSLYHAPANQFTAGFIGSPPMNFFRGQIVREGERMAFVEDNSAAAPFRLTLTEEVATLAAPRAGKGVCGRRIFRWCRREPEHPGKPPRTGKRAVRKTSCACASIWPSRWGRRRS
jgi:multiple sugar transport system ATP-binding protein